VTERIDAATVEAATPQYWTQIRDGKLYSFWVPRMWVHGHKNSIVISKGGQMVECGTRKEAAQYAVDLVAKWKAEAQESRP